jgi:DNA polymerase III subunit delta'
MKFSEIPGNQQIKNKLVRTVLDQRVSHAQLFFGSEDSSKLALAIAYAQFINCTGKQAIPGKEQFTQDDSGVTNSAAAGPDACGTCPSCVKYQKLAHPDLHFIYPVATTKKVANKPQSKHFLEEWRAFLLGNNFECGLQDWYEAIGIENKQGIINVYDCNEIITSLSYKSYESDYKVMIIWMVEKLNHAAAPKILKIIEEPPEKTLFLLISEEPDQIIKTILSRTLMVKIPKSPAIRNVKNEDDSIHFVPFRQWMRACYGAKVPELIKFASEIVKSGREKQKSFLLYSLRTIGFCASLNYLRQLPDNIEGEELEFIQKFSQFIKPGNLPQFNTLLNDAIYHIERNAHPATLFLDLSLKIVRLFKPAFLPSGEQ